MKKPKGKPTTSIKSKTRDQKSSGIGSAGKNTQLESMILYGCLAIVLLFITYLRLRLSSFPLERDEGEYALMGQMILKGIPPYEMAYNMKLPGVYYMYALLMSIFGQTGLGVHYGGLLVNLASTFMLFHVGKKLANGYLGLMAAASYGLISLSPGHLGFAAHATHFIVLFAVAGLLTLLHYIEKQKWWLLALSGFCFGLSFIMKQQAVFLLVFGMLALGLSELQRKPVELLKTSLRVVVYGVCMVLPYLLVVLTAMMNGSFDQFWHWTYEYAGEYAGINTFSKGVKSAADIFPNITEGMQLFWWLGLAGLVALFFTDAIKPYRWLIFMFAILSFACVMPGFYFRRHYYIVFLPALGILTGVTMIFLSEQFKKHKLSMLSALPMVAFVLMVIHSLYMHRFYFFEVPTEELCKVIYSPNNPFVESVELGKYLKEHTTPEDKIGVLGSEPQICFYADRLPATGYIYAYPLTENQPYSKEMRQDMLAEIEAAKPKYLMFINSSYSWGGSSEAVKDITEWYTKEQADYNIVCVIDLDPKGKGTWIWGDEAKTYKPKNTSWIWLHERKAVE